MLPSSFLMPAGDTTSRYIEAIYLAHEDLVVNSRAATVSWQCDFIQLNPDRFGS